MVLKNAQRMKQPELGKTIIELRKQKGLTQEELVEKCNITVRTIQRIEAGETTPRSYTIKTILNAMGFEYESVFGKKYISGKFDKVLRIHPSNLNNVLISALIAGIIYFIMGFAETTFYAPSLSDLSFGNWPDLSTNGDAPPFSYSLTKIISIVSFSFFMRGFVLIGSYYKNYLIEIMAFLMIVINIVFGISEMISINTDEGFFSFILVSRALTIGVIMMPFGVGILRLKSLGMLSSVTGVLEIVTGVCFATLFLSVIGLIILLPLELLELLLLYKASLKIKSPLIAD